MATTTTPTGSATTTSGLNVNALVTQLMTVERLPITKLTAQETTNQSKLTAYGTVKSAVSTLQTALQSLTSSSFQGVTASFSDATAFSATPGSSAVPGSYTLNVSTLAQAQKLATAGQADTTSAIGSGATTTLSFDFGTTAAGVFTSNGTATKTVTIGTNNSLAGIRDAINAANIGVTANIVSNGSATNPFQLVLTSAATGLDQTMQITTSGDASIDALLHHQPGGVTLTEQVPAQNATFTVDGISVSKSSNTVTDVISGVTLNLNKANTGAVTMTVAKDTATINKSISAFVKSYNDLLASLKSVSTYNATTKTGAALNTDSSIRSLQAQFRSVLNSSVTSGSYTSLSNIGIGFQRDGTLAIDQTKLDSALANNFSDVVGLFTSTGTPKGYATQLDTLATNTLSSTGVITNRTNGINATIKILTERRLALEARMITIEKTYRTQYSKLDAMLGSMNATSTYLTQQLSKI